MLVPKLIECVDCATVPVLLKEIDCKLTDIAKKRYNNIIFSLNYKLDDCTNIDLLIYKNILQFKACNPCYASKYSVEQIASKVKILINK